MNYTEVTIECKNTDETCDRLTALGVDGFVIENEDDFKAFLENNRQYWDYVDSSLEESSERSSARAMISCLQISFPML